MALVLVEGFDHLSAAQFTAKGWSANPTAVNSGRLAGQCATFGSISNSTKVLPSSYSTLIVGLAFKCASLPSAGNTEGICEFRTATGGTVAALGINSAGKVVVLNGAINVGTVIATGTTVISAGAWTYVELKIVVAGAAGSCEVHLNGNSASPEIATTTGNFGSTNIAQINVGSPNTGGQVGVNIDDVYVVDTTGVAPDNTFLGDVNVGTLYPDGDGAHTQWTPDSGSPHFSRVNEATPDDDTSYVADGTVGDRDSYTFGSLASLLGTVFGVQTNVYARKDDVGTRQICAVTRPTTVDHDGATKTLSTSYQCFSEISPTNPDTSAAWTISDIDAAEFGVKVVA
jgi:hypothetical protein